MSDTRLASGTGVPFDALQVGDGFQGRGRTVTEADVVAFAGLTGDYHPQHTDQQWASASAFGERIAHGMLVLSFAVGLAPIDPEYVLALRRVEDAVFKRPVRLGDTIRLDGQISELKPLSEDAGLVTWAWTIRNQDAELVMRAKVQVLWRRTAPAA
ncbi:MAG TPA: MaoC/PaaZ C-terminal domain-containing protein [Solirubrobacteraceae bacterium]|nr:MaoC/PaaZ C-terminal domain-containing protein [Solirubrobacteraceae bacterium]